MKKDIKNTKELVMFVVDLAKAIEAANSDGKINWLDIGHFIGIVPSLSRAVMGSTEIPAEIKDLDMFEIMELKKAVKEALNAAGVEESKKVDEIVVTAIEAAAKIIELVNALKK